MGGACANFATLLYLDHLDSVLYPDFTSLKMIRKFLSHSTDKDSKLQQVHSLAPLLTNSVICVVRLAADFIIVA